jgi:hypothetical protein
MKNKKVNYSNRQVKGEEDVFSPLDSDADLVGGVNQSDPYGYSYAALKTGSSATEDNNYGSGEEAVGDSSLQIADEEIEEKLGSINSVSFEQTGSFTGDGTYLANVTATITDVRGATNYEVQFTKIS